MVITHKGILNYVLQKTIPIDDGQRTAAKVMVSLFVNRLLIDTMKDEDELFRALYRRIQYTGSFYEGLRVGEATEFDLNLILQLPILDKYNYNNNYKLIHNSFFPNLIEGFDIPPAFAVCYTNQLMPTSDPRYNDYGKLNEFSEKRKAGIFRTETKYLLLPYKLRYWFESVATRALNKINRSFLSQDGWISLHDSELIIKVIMSKSGPALTFHIASDTGLEIDVDLVPVINIDKDCDPFLVPKPHYSNERSNLWRLSYPIEESRLLYNQGCAKNVIKLLKRLRDLKGAPFVPLKSYFLKTVVLWELRADSSIFGIRTWHDRDLYKNFVRCLKKLQLCLNDKKIPFYHDKKHNLLENVNGLTIYNMERELNNVIYDIECNPPETLIKYFVREQFLIQQCKHFVEVQTQLGCIIALFIFIIATIGLQVMSDETKFKMKFFIAILVVFCFVFFMRRFYFWINR